MRAYTKGLPALGAIILTLASVVVSVAESNDLGCRRQSKPVTIHLSAAKYPAITDHIRDSWAMGFPRELVIHRRNAKQRRDRLLKWWQARHPQPKGDGLDLDEAPAAVLRSHWKADVRPIPQAENRSAGASLGNQIRGWCSGQHVVYSIR